MLVTGCAVAPDAPPAPAPQLQPLAETMSEAAKARDERLTAKERDLYREAARNYPAAKEPWARMAESYFEAGDYGNAILAAQEVMQRDRSDAVGAGVLAVSGLRVSTQALGVLRSQSTHLAPDARTQAETLAKTLRELLGETVLVPQPAEAPAHQPPPRRAAPRPAPSALTPAPAPAPKPPPAKNPFDALK